MDDADEIDKVFTLSGYGTQTKLLQAVHFILADLLDIYVEPRTGHSASIAFDGFSIGKDHHEKWHASFTIVATPAFIDKVAETVGRYQ